MSDILGMMPSNYVRLLLAKAVTSQLCVASLKICLTQSKLIHILGKVVLKIGVKIVRKENTQRFTGNEHFKGR